MIGGAGRYRTCITGYRLGSVLRELPRREGSETGGADGSRTRIFRIDNPAFSPVELPHLKKRVRLHRSIAALWQEYRPPCVAIVACVSTALDIGFAAP